MSDSTDTAIHFDSHEALVALISVGALTTYPHLDIAKDSHIRWRWAMLTYMTQQIGAYLLALTNPPFISAREDAKEALEKAAVSSQRIVPAFDDFFKLCTLLLRYEEVMGITPAARLKLGETGESLLGKAKGTGE